MTTPEYEVRPYREDDLPQILQLQKYLWGPDVALNGAYFSWLYQQNPYLRGVLVYVTFHRGALVGMRGFYGSRWEGGNPRRETIMLCGDDLVITPEYRNRGVFTAMMNAALADLSLKAPGFALTLSGGRVTVIGSLGMGWKRVGVMDQVERRPSGWRALRARLGMPMGSEPFARLDAKAGGSPGSGSIWLSRQPDPGAMAGLVAALDYDGRMRHVRDAEYFDWRFRNPFRQYRFLYAGHPALEGYLVIRRAVPSTTASPVVHLADWEARSPEVGAALLRAALDWGRFDGLVAWAAALPEWAPRLLSRSGFTVSDEKLSARGLPCALLLPVKTSPGAADWTFAGKLVSDPGMWDLRMLYSMRG